MSALCYGVPSARVTDLAIAALYDPTVPTPADATSVVTQALVSMDQAPLYCAGSALEALIAADANNDVSSLCLSVFFDFPQLSPNVPEYIPLSNYLFPTVPGIEWNSTKTPRFSTQIAPAVSGREVRVSNYAYPVWEWELSYEFLREGAMTELQTLMGFFLARSGSYDTFLYDDPSETNVVEAAIIGTGDNTQYLWTLYKTYGGFEEPCGYVDPASLKVYFGELEQTSGWTFVSPNQVQFDVPPSAGTVISADFTWYYRVRFGEDSQTYANFMFNLWELKKLTLQSVKP